MTKSNIRHDVYGEPINFQRNDDMALVWNALRRAVRRIGLLFSTRR